VDIHGQDPDRRRRFFKRAAFNAAKQVNSATRRPEKAKFAPGVDLRCYTAARRSALSGSGLEHPYSQYE
jgi:hypothetical protein